MTPQSPTIDKGQSIVLTSNALGGSPPYSYQWYGGSSQSCPSDAAISGATGATYTASPTSATYYCYRVTDNVSATNLSTTDLVSVDPALLSGAVSPNLPTLDRGQSISLDANPSSGTPPYSYQWYAGSASSCSSDPAVSGATASSLLVSPTTVTYYCYTVGDSSQGTPVATAISATDLVAVNPTLVAAAVTPASPVIDRGQSVTLTSNPSGGTPPYSYQWYTGTSTTCSLDTQIVGATSPTYLASPAATAYFCYAVTDSATASSTAYSPTDVVTVNATLAAGTPTPSSPSIDSGETLTLTVNPVGGTPPYSYQWYAGASSSCASATAISGATHPTYTASPSVSTYYCYSLKDSSSNSPTVLSPTDAVTVNPVLNAGSPSPPSPGIDPGQSVTLTATPTQGTPPYTYQWYSGPSSTCSSDSAVGGATSATYTATPAVNTYYCYSVTDSSVGSPAPLDYSATDYVTIDTSLAAGPVTPTAPTIDAGQTVLLSAMPSGGTPPYTFQWYDGTSPTCAGNSPIAHATGSTLLAGPTVGTYYCYQVNDSSPGTPKGTALSLTDQVSVNPALVAGSVAPSAPTIDSGQSVTMSATVSGGTAPYRLQWYSGTSSTCTLDQAIAGATTTTYTAAPASNTYYCFVVTDNSTNAPIVPSATALVSVQPPLAAGAITPASPAIDAGQTVTLASAVSGGWAPFSIQWYSGASPTCADDAAISGATSSTYSPSPGASTYYCYSVTDSSVGTPAASSVSATDLVTVNPPLVAGPVTPTSPIIDSGQPVTLLAAAANGTPGYSYQWYSGPSPSCTGDTSIAGAIQATLTAYPTKTTYYCYAVKDSSVGGPTLSPLSPTDLVTVEPALTAGAVTPNQPTIDSGQSVVLQAAASGGLAPYTYQWYSGAYLGCSSDTPIAGGNTSTLVVSPTSATYYCYSITDVSLDPPTVRSVTDLVSVSTPLLAGTATPVSPGIDPGQSVELTAHPTGGTPAYAYQWYAGSSSSCTADTLVSGATEATYLAPSPTKPYYCYAVSDSSTDPPTVRSGTDAVTVNTPLVAGPLSPTGPTIDAGQSVTLTANASGGTAPYGYQWSSGTNSDCSLDTAIAGATGATDTASPSATAYFCYVATDSSPGTPAASAVSATALIHVNPTLAGGTPTPASAGIDQGQTLQLSATPTGGTPPYSFQWYAGPSATCSSDSAIGGATSSSLTTTPSTSTYYCYVVTDNSTNAPSVRSATDLVTVNPTLQGGTATPGSPEIDPGQSVSLKANPSGGTAPFLYQWFGGPSPTCADDTMISGATATTYLASPATRTYYCYEVSDSSVGLPSEQAISSTDVVTINSPLVANQVTPNLPTVPGGQSIALTSNASGGAAPYHVQWRAGPSTTCADDPALPGATSLTLTLVPDATAYYCYNATDSSPGVPPANASSPTDLVTVTLGAEPATPAAPAIDVGQTLTFTAHPVGGTPPYTYQWFSGSSATCASDTAIGGATSPTLAAAPTAATYYCYEVTDSGSPHASETSLADLVTVNSALEAGAPTPATPVVDSGQSVTLTAAASGGTTPYHYQWYGGSSATCGSDSAIGGANSATLSVSPGTATYYCYVASDSSVGTPAANAASTTVEVRVNGALVAGAPTATSSKLDAGQSVTFTAVVSGGTGPYGYQWYSGASTTCTSDSQIPGATASTYTVTPSSTEYFCYVATDSSSSPPQVPSATVQVTVDPALVAGAITPASPAIDAGQTVMLTANPSGGTAPYTLQWYTGSSATCSSDKSISGATSTTFSTTLTVSTYFCYVLSDAATGSPPEAVASATVEVTVNAALTAGALTPAAPTVDAGQSITLTAAPTGGTPAYTYQWYDGSSSTCSKDTLIAGATGATIVVAPTAQIYYCYTVTDSSVGTPATSATSATDDISLNPALKVGAITPTSPSITSGDTVTLTANATGGTTPYSYQWYAGTSSTCSDDTAVSTATSATYTVKPSANTYYCVVVTDSSKGTPAGTGTSATDLVSVSPKVATFLGLPAVEGYIVLGVIIAVLALIVFAIVFVVRRRRKGGRGTASDYL